MIDSKKIYRVLFLALNLFVFGLPTKAQNLVINPSFEDFDTCILNINNYGYPEINDWINPTIGTPDYYNTCSTNPQCVPGCFACGNSQLPRTGNAISGIVPLTINQFGTNPSSEFVQGRLTLPLVKDSFYCVRFYLSLKEDYKRSIDRFGVYFSNAPVSTSGYFLNLLPQIESPSGHFFTDMVNWEKWQGTYKATGGEQYITIGNFHSFASTNSQISGVPFGDFRDSISYYYIDDVSVEQIPSYYAAINIGADSTLCDTTGFSQTLAVPAIYDSVKWSTGAVANQVTINRVGQYSVICYFGDCEVKDTITYRLFAKQNYIPLTGKTICAVNAPAVANVSLGFAHYLWSNGDTTAFQAFYQTGIYYVTASNSCQLILDTISIIIHPTPLPPLVHDTAVCEGTTPFALTPNGNNIWWFAHVTDTLPLANPIVYPNIAGNQNFYALQVVNGCKSPLATVTVAVNSLPLVDIGGNQNHCTGTTIKLETRNDTSYNYLWNTGDTLYFINVSEPNLYSCQVTNSCGRVIDQADISFLNCFDCIYLPNAFSPNGDGNNDVYQPYSNCPFIYYQLEIYNRWGEKMFETPDIRKAWDGSYKSEPQPMAVYVYHLTFINEVNEATRLKGSITLVR